MINICYEADNIFLWLFEVKTNVTVFFNKNTIIKKNENLEKKNKEVDFEVLNKLFSRFNFLSDW